MLPVTENYVVWPAVIPADTETEMTFMPAERAFIMNDGAEYSVTIISVNDDETDYYHPSRSTRLNCTARGGALKFTYAFPGEQEHILILEKDGVKLQETTVYSLGADIYGLRPMRGDLHSHSYRSDGQRDPAALAGHYREQGYDFFALTDHNRFYPGGEIDEAYEDTGTGFTRITGEEVHAPGSVIHIVHVGGSRSVADEYVHDREGYERAIAQYEANVPEHVPEAFRGRYARAQWATDRIHAAGGLAIFPHPFWKPGRSRIHNVRDDYAVLLLKSGMFDAFELVGGMQQPDVNRAVAMWADVRAEGYVIPVVGSSDVHGLDRARTFPHRFTIVFAVSAATRDIMQAVKAGMCVAVEADGDGYERQYRAYGSYRLVCYAQFLLSRYFPAQQRICEGEGVAMRAYAMEQADAELIRLHAKLAEDHRARFFGQTPPAALSEKMTGFEEKWRGVHLEGPLTKGSSVDAPPVTRQI